MHSRINYLNNNVYVPISQRYSIDLAYKPNTTIQKSNSPVSTNIFDRFPTLQLTANSNYGTEIPKNNNYNENTNNNMYSRFPSLSLPFLTDGNNMGFNDYRSSYLIQQGINFISR